MMNYITVPISIIVLMWAAVATVLAGGDSAAGAQSAPPLVRIVKPVENGVVPVGDVPIELTAENLMAGSSQRIEIYLDDKLAGTVPAGVITYTLSVAASGPHYIRATLVDNQNPNLSTADVRVTAAPETPKAAFNTPWMAPVMLALIVFVILLVFVALRLSPHPVPDQDEG